MTMVLLSLKYIRINGSRYYVIRDISVGWSLVSKSLEWHKIKINQNHVNY